MTGGIPAIEGFDTQASIILELMLEAFQRYPGAQFRPEGLDDLDMRWNEPPDRGTPRLRYHQFKKVSQRASGKPVEWTLATVARELLGDAVRKLAGNDAEQVWVLGDTATPEVHEMLSAGRNAPSATRAAYLNALHRLAKAETEVAKDSKPKGRLDQWSPSADTHASVDDDVGTMLDSFCGLASDVAPERLAEYRTHALQLHAQLPDVLGRITLRESHGHEKQIVQRVITVLESRFGLSRAIVENTLFRNLRGYISDVAKEPGRTITREDFEYELTRVWPRAVATRSPPKLGGSYLRRPLLVEQVLAPPVAARCVMGPSGAGKTLLAGEVAEFLEKTRPDDVVLYAEVGGDTTMRDVLAGMAFMLRSLGIPDILQSAVEMAPGDEEAVRNVARRFRDLSRKVVLLVDIVRGDETLGFRRELAAFARELKGASSQIIVFSQKDTFRELSRLERQAAEIAVTDLPGLHWGEFQELVALHHPGEKSSAVYALHQRLTAGRSAGILPALADALAGLATIEAMQALASRPSEELLSEAHRARFDELPVHLRNAAQRVVCFSLPMTVSEAVELFQDEPMRAALDALSRVGLLRRDDNERVEMHETVRAGLQRLLPPGFVRATHSRLATHYERSGIPTAQIHHLEQAGQSDEARRLARKRFLAGEDRDVLARYVAEHRLVSAPEVISLLLAEETPERYLLPRLLQRVKEPNSASDLWAAVRSVPERFDRDVQWAWRVAEAILRCEPRLLQVLVEFGLEQPLPKRREGSRLEAILFAARRAEMATEESFLSWFTALPPGKNRAVLPFLLLQPEIRRLAAAFQVIVSERIVLVSRHAFRAEQVELQLHSEAEVDAFLNALPLAEASKMLVSRSPLLGPFSAFIWQVRELVGRRCRTVLSEGKTGEVILQNAMRVLVHLADRSVLDLSKPLRTDSGSVAAVAWTVPVLLGASETVAEFEAIAVNPTTSLESRLMAASCAAGLGADLGALFTKMVSAAPAQTRGLRFIFMLLAGMHPYPEALPLISEALDEDDSALKGVLQPWIVKVAELPVPAATEVLLKALTKPEFAGLAAIAMQKKRTRRAILPIIELLKLEMDAKSASNVVMTALASGPDSLEPFRSVWEKHPGAMHWRWVLAGRLRAESEASELVAAALDSSQPWQARRVAILAAGRLPFEAAMKSIAPALLAEPLLLPDTDVSIRSHMLLAFLLQEFQADVANCFLRGRSAFIQDLGDAYEAWREQELLHSTVLPSAPALGWLWDRLEARGLRESLTAIDGVQNELHLPLLQGDVVRGLRRQAQLSELEEIIRHPPSDWLRIRAFRERRTCGWAAHLEELVDQAPMHCRPAMSELLGQPRRTHPAPSPPVQAVTAESPVIRMMDYAQAQAFLNEEGNVDDTPIVLSMSREELQALAAEVDPGRDYRWELQPRPRPPRISVSSEAFVIVDTHAMQLSNHAAQRAALRPAIVANPAGIWPSWHREHLRNPVYAKRFFASLEAHGDRYHFSQVLQRDHDLIVPYIDELKMRMKLQNLVDVRAISILSLYIFAGTDDFFGQLCSLICEVKTPEVDVALAQVFERLVGIMRGPRRLLDEDLPRERGLRVVTRHPRFWHVPHAVDRLLDLALSSPKASWRRREFFELLSHQPAAYSYFESQVLHAEDFVHYTARRDDVDFYDATADDLFRRVDEGPTSVPPPSDSPALTTTGRR